MHLLRYACLSLLCPCLPGVLAASTVAKEVPRSTLTCQAESGCLNETIDGRVYRVLRSPGMVVRVSISTEGEYTRADVSIVNDSPTRLSVEPAGFRVDVVRPRRRSLGYVEPASLRLPPGSPTKKSAERRSAVPAYALIPPKPEPDLLPGSVQPRGVLEGKVFFDRDRRAKTLNLVLPIGGASFEFPYELP